MSVLATSFLAMRAGDHLYVRAVGLANMKHAPVLDAFIDSERAAGATTVCVDLSSCTGMDSTFMGLLVGTSQSMVQQGGRLVVINPSEGNRRLLDMLGVTEVVPVSEGCVPPEVDFVAVESRAGVGAIQRMELVLRAHRDLVALGPANQGKFSAFIGALEKDLERQRKPARQPAEGGEEKGS